MEGVPVVDSRHLATDGAPRLAAVEQRFTGGRRMTLRFRNAAFDLVVVLALAAPAASQQPPAASPQPAAAEGWNDPRALALVAAARARREAPRADSGLDNYHSHADGYVYFYLDRRGAPERTLVKVDQLALDVYWAAPNRTKQRIVGMRDVSRLPNRMYYHLDHLTVVQDEFGDLIRLGDGDEVQAVPHPAAPGSERVYDFRLADSLTLRIPGTPQPLRVYEVAVRPRRLDRPGFIGSLFVDPSSGAIVRMTFTFTPASYVDRRLDYINISLENALFEGRYWLPHEQRVEIRRQIPELDFPAGAVIRGVFWVGQYRFNQPLPPDLFAGPRVEAAPAAARKAYPFPNGIYADLNAEGLSPPPEMAQLREQAMQIVKQRYLSGLPKLRLRIGGASSALRYDRAEGIFLGAGMAYVPGGAVQLEGSVGLATASGIGSLALGARTPLGEGASIGIGGYSHALRDLGAAPALPGALNTLSAALFGADYLDPYYASGIELRLDSRLHGAWSGALRLAAEEQRSAPLADPTPLLNGSDRFRPVRPIEPGTLLSARGEITRAGDTNGALSWNGRMSIEGATLEGRAFGRSLLEASAIAHSADHGTTLRLTGQAGAAFGPVPPQGLFLLGGPGTLPGYAPRRFAGDEFARLGLEASRAVLGPWLRLRGLGAAAWTGFGGATTAPAAWDVAPTGGVRTSVGLGVGLIYDILRTDLYRGLQKDGRWQLVISVSPDLWDIL
ncbi:MAG: hypothetical protein IRZ00_01340 [Gemmatimonadetes bacterium]|nr:hypothetical protein [Gemmatimonadota bacterium]